MRLTTITLFTLAVLFVAATVPVAGQENVSVVAESQAAAKQLFFCNLTESDLRSDSPVV